VYSPEFLIRELGAQLVNANASNALFKATTLVIVGLYLCGGCGDTRPPTYRVTGQVVLPDGAALACGGRVVFTNANESPPKSAKGYFGSDGKFDLTTFDDGDGAVAGEYHVAVFPNVPDDRPPGMSPAQYVRAMQPIDDRFKYPGKSGLQFTVSPETEPHDFRLEVTRPRRRR